MTTNPIESNSCRHAWVCVAMDHNDGLYTCQKCGLHGDGFGRVWPHPQAVSEVKEKK